MPHQTLVEFMPAVTRPRKSGDPLMGVDAARREVEDLMHTFAVLYPNEAVVRAAIRGSAVYGLSWFDAHLWAYAEVFHCSEILSEDFQQGRMYGRVRTTNPFL